MKYRLDFVTNSSSSSYVCDICGDDESGWDMSLSDAEMYQCVNGHTFHERCAEMGDMDWKATLISLVMESIKSLETDTYYTPENKMKKLEQAHELLAEIESGEMDEYDMQRKAENHYDLRHEMPESICPICTFKVSLDEDMAQYLLVGKGMTSKAVLAEIKEQFTSYDAFCTFLKEKMEEIDK